MSIPSSSRTGAEGNQRLSSLLFAFRLEPSSKREASFAFSSKPPLSGWVAYSYEAALPFFLLEAKDSRATQVYSFASGINKEAFILLADLGEKIVLIMKRPGKEGDPYLRLVLQRLEDFDRAIGVLRKLDLVSDSLTAHANLSDAIELLRVGAERHFVNRGLFANYFLRERMIPHLAERGRKAERESAGFFNKLGGEIPTNSPDVAKVLSELGYKPILISSTAHPEFRLFSGSTKLDATCVVTEADSLDTKKSDEVVPSYQAVSALRQVHWVMLTNGRLWRLYSSRVSSSSTNYLEIDLEGIISATDPRLLYFVSLFSAASLAPKPSGSDLDSIFEGGLRYAQEIKDELSSKVFEGQLFLNLVRGVVASSSSREYREEELEKAKATALRLLYRVLFILYAESRNLLPVSNPNYSSFSLDGIRQRLGEFDKLPEGVELWRALSALFRSIAKGDAKAGVPAYDGELFREDVDLDHLEPRNKYLAPAIRELTEIGGKGVDYQNLGVRHLGSLYEALLEYDVRQAEEDLVVYKDGTLDAAYAADLKAKPKPFVSKGELYLSSKGLARKGTGSYYTPDELVKFLVKNGLQAALEQRQKNFETHIAELKVKKSDDADLEKSVIDDLLGIKVVDPAMGSGHFLVAAVDYITTWIMERLKEYPETPLAKIIEEDREKVIKEQKEKGIEISTELLSDNIILKRLVMKRCVYGVDVNPLAVELAKLSLWLDSFTIGTPLTFLDHHIRVGDSLIGLWLKNFRTKASLQGTLDSWVETVIQVGVDLSEKVSMPPDLNLEEVQESRRVYEENRKKTHPARLMLDLMTARVLAPEESAKLPLNFGLIEKSLHQQKKPDFWNEVEKAEAISAKFRAFHWELEFPDAKSEAGMGFDVVITNPPWDAVKPEDDDFFSTYYPLFRRITSKPEKQKVMKKMLHNKDIKTKYETYRSTIQAKVNFFKNSNEFVKRGSGDTNLWKLFLERCLNILSEHGGIAMVIPSGIVTDEGAKQLRMALFNGRIRGMYEFENTNGIFDIHRSYKFVLLVADRTAPTSEFPAAFYLHDTQSLEGKCEQEKFVTMPLELIRLSAPESLSIPEVRTEDALSVFDKLYKTNPLLSDEKKGWTISLLTELHRTGDSDLFRSDGKGWPLIEGKNFHQFIPDYEKPEFTIIPEAGLKRTSTHREYKHLNKWIHERVRLGFREVAASTNVRSTVACVIPPNSFSPHTVILALPKTIKGLPTGVDYYRMVAYLCGIFNSFVFDFLLRTRITMHVSFFYVYQTPVPSRVNGDLVTEVMRIAGRLSAVDIRFKDFSSALGVEAGPLMMKDRIEMTARLNAIAAKLYGLDTEELKIVLHSFEGFEEDKELEKLGSEAHWSDDLIRRFNGEVRKRVLSYFVHETPVDVSAS